MASLERLSIRELATLVRPDVPIRVNPDESVTLSFGIRKLTMPAAQARPFLRGLAQHRATADRKQTSVQA